jgi:hypothetical protein
MSDWGGDQVAAGVRLAPAEHYDQAMTVLQSMPTSGGDPQLLQLGWCEVIAQALLGLLRAQMDHDG